MITFNEHIAADLPHDFFYMDIDGSAYKRETKILRVMESKRENERITDGQKLQLPLYATMIALMIEKGHIHAQSAVLLVRNIADNYREATIARVLPTPGHFQLSRPIYATGELLYRLEGARPLPEEAWARLNS
jgi:hypothetical protein